MILLGILTALLEYSFFSIPFFASIFYVIYHSLYTMDVGVKPVFSLLIWKMFPTGLGLDGMSFGMISFFLILFILLMGYHIYTYSPFWIAIGMFFVGFVLVRMVSGIGGIAPFIKFILSVIGTVLGVALGLFLLIVTFLRLKDKYTDWKYERKQEIGNKI